MIAILLVMLPVGAIGFVGWLALRYVRACERQAAGRAELPAHEREVVRLRDEVMTLQSEVESLRERHEFVERLLERPRPEAAS